MSEIAKIPVFGKTGGVKRSSDIELFRIISMLVIVVHHYVVNSGLLDAIALQNNLTKKSMFLLLIGCGGKTAINGFVVITGYFMCKSNITARKFVKLLGEIMFYKIIIYLIFTLSGYQPFGLRTFINAVSPINNIADGFTSAYIVFFLFIPFLNILVNAMDKKQHTILMLLCIGVYSVWGTTHFNVVFNYVTWFSVLFIIGSWLRLYPLNWFESSKITGIIFISLVSFSLLSVVCCTLLDVKVLGNPVNIYHSFYFITDSNKILALTTGISGFMWFKTLKIKYSRIVNSIAASSFGVLLIHANSDAMRRWLWVDVLDNVSVLNENFMLMIFRVFLSVLAVYAVCTIIDMLRINFLENAFMRLYDKHIDEKIKNIGTCIINKINI